MVKALLDTNILIDCLNGAPQANDAWQLLLPLATLRQLQTSP